MQLNEFTPESRNHSINQLARQLEHSLPKNIINNQIEKLSDPVFLLRFLRSGKFNPEKALKRCVKFVNLFEPSTSDWPEMTKHLLSADQPGSKMYNFMRNYLTMYVCENVGIGTNTGAVGIITDPPERDFDGSLEEYCSSHVVATLSDTYSGGSSCRSAPHNLKAVSYWMPRWRMAEPCCSSSSLALEILTLPGTTRYLPHQVLHAW